MKQVIYCYERCSTCRKALKWLAENGVEVEVKSIVDETPTASELKQFYEKSGLPLRRFFNTSGMKYRELGLSQKLKDMPEIKQLELLASDGMLIKRPLFVNDELILLGFKEENWQVLLK